MEHHSQTARSLTRASIDVADSLRMTGIVYGFTADPLFRVMRPGLVKEAIASQLQADLKAQIRRWWKANRPIAETCELHPAVKLTWVPGPSAMSGCPTAIRQNPGPPLDPETGYPDVGRWLVGVCVRCYADANPYQGRLLMTGGGEVATIFGVPIGGRYEVQMVKQGSNDDEPQRREAMPQ